MENLRRKTMSVELSCVCVSNEYFYKHFSKYYDLLSYEVVKSKKYGSYINVFYKVKSLDFFENADVDKDLYYELPHIICASKIY